MMVIGDLLRNNARRNPGREALVSGDERITWGELNDSVNRLANGLLAHGVNPGDRVAFIMGNTPDIVRLYYAVAKIGCTSVPIMPRSVSREIVHIVSSVFASVIVASADQAAAVREALPNLESIELAIGIGEGHGLHLDLAAISAAGGVEEPPVRVDPESTYAIQFTSGTTGAPKGCMLSHAHKMLSRVSMLSHLAYREEDRALVFMPMTASLGADVLHAHVLRGMATVLVQRFDEAEMLRLIESERISVMYALESTFDRLLAHEAMDTTDWSRMRFFMASSATRHLGASVARLRRARNFNAVCWNAYGCTEGGGWLSFMDSRELGDVAADADARETRASIGRECMLANVDCVDEQGHSLPAGEIGEMVFSAPWLFSGYWDLPERTAEAVRDGRYHTGDLARKDERGYIFLEGRMKDMIKSGGVNVYPAEIEMVLKMHASVKEAAVVGLPDPEWGERVVACVIADGERDAVALTEHCRRELAGYKVPKAIVFLPDFPRDVVGKILKRQLRDQLTAAK